MSTEHQQYSIENQEAAISEYARQHRFQIVRSYSDEAKSGIDLKHRPALRQLLRDVTNPDVGIKAILVYDVSRWGRFQDTDESAFHEFWCKQFGVSVHYCAEPFANDNSIAASLLKTLKRTMAGEYLRELSARTYAGQLRLAQKGFKIGGRPGFGLRRLLVDGAGKPKMILANGERKSIQTDRVRYVAGPAKELRVIRKIYTLFLDHDFNFSQIARELNRLRISREVPKPWKRDVIQRILSHPKYTGCVVFNQKSGRLHSRPIRNPRDQWVIQPNSFAPIVPKERFEQAQEKLLSRESTRSDEKLLADLRAFTEGRCRVTWKMLTESNNMASAQNYRVRFGSFRRALTLAKWTPPFEASEIDRRRWMKFDLQDRFEKETARAGYSCRSSRGRFRSPRGELIVVEVARSYRGQGGTRRWEIRLTLDGGPGLPCIVQRFADDNRTPKDYVFFPHLPDVEQKFRFCEEEALRIGVITDSLENAVDLLVDTWHATEADDDAKWVTS
jgi:DNA invertase Pin-like site-specific DNA recombinase